jgi:hypothetical protein
MKRKEKKKEQVRILVGGIAYRGQVVAGRELAEGDELIELLEDVEKAGAGAHDTTTPSVQTGSMVQSRWDGTRHAATRERQFTMIDGKGAGVKAKPAPAPSPVAVVTAEPIPNPGPAYYTDTMLLGMPGYRRLWEAWTAATLVERETFCGEIHAYFAGPDHVTPRPPSDDPC